MQFTEEGATGLGSAREQETYRVPPNKVRQLQPGEVFVISGGRAQKVKIARCKISDQAIAEARKLTEPEQSPLQLTPGHKAEPERPIIEPDI